MDPSTNHVEGSVTAAVDEIPNPPSVGSVEPVACNAEELVTKSDGLLPGRPEFSAGIALIPETAPRLDGWKEKLEAEVPVFK